jgi:hypothetical protein
MGCSCAMRSLPAGRPLHRTGRSRSRRSRHLRQHACRLMAEGRQRILMTGRCGSQAPQIVSASAR